MVGMQVTGKHTTIRNEAQSDATQTCRLSEAIAVKTLIESARAMDSKDSLLCVVIYEHLEARPKSSGRQLYRVMSTGRAERTHCKYQEKGHDMCPSSPWRH